MTWPVRKLSFCIFWHWYVDFLLLGLTIVIPWKIYFEEVIPLVHNELNKFPNNIEKSSVHCDPFTHHAYIYCLPKPLWILYLFACPAYMCRLIEKKCYIIWGPNCFFTTYFSQLVIVLIGNNVLITNVSYFFRSDYILYTTPKTNYSKIIFVYIFLKLISEFFYTSST